MPEEITGPDIVTEFEEWLDQRELTIGDADNIEMVIYARLRSLFTAEQLHARAHMIIVQTEELIQTPGAFRDTETGEPVEPLLVENFKGSQEDYQVMIQQAAAGISDDALAELLGTTGEEE